jgi:hypothetical protein
MAKLEYFRFQARELFETSWRHARLKSLFTRFSGQRKQLLSFESVAPFIQTRIYRGVQQIDIAKIMGTFDREHDFDYNFRPLHKYLQTRWVELYVLAQTVSWPAIRVYQVGPIYFVEDGHHRVSVARALGQQYLDAEVWENPLRNGCCTSLKFRPYSIFVPFKVESHLKVCHN